ncbi:MAG: PD-(D/E)XK nuclease family protein [Thermoguttaceae bacterium]|nr:PD-(D/E)XK nuclease family protein [Thermoguttaceae bacterium]
MGQMAVPEPLTNACTCQVFVGPARSGVTTRLIEEIRSLLPHLPPASILWLVPSYRAAQALREQLVDSGLGATLAFWIATFDQLACRILASGGEPFLPLSRALQWELLRNVLQELAGAGQLVHLGPIAHTRGLVDRLYHWVSRCERANVTPDVLRQVNDGRLTPQLADFVGVLDRYLKTAAELRWYDAEQRLWRAVAILQRQPPGVFPAFKMVVVDGFADFAAAQLALIGQLAGRAERLLVGLPCGQGREDLFAKPRRTLRMLSALFDNEPTGLPRVREIRLSTEPFFEAPGLKHLERYLFTLPGEPPASASPEGVEILVGASVQQEVELVACEIKKLLVDGDPRWPGERVRPGDVLVVVRSFGEYADRLWEVFGQFGIPIYLESGIPLRRIGAIRGLLGLVDLERRDWPLRQLLAVLRHSYFRPGWASTNKMTWLPAVEQALRSCGVAGGRELLTARLKSLAENALSEVSSLPQEAFAKASEILGGLANLTQQWSTPAPWKEWINRWQKAVDLCGLANPPASAGNGQEDLGGEGSQSLELPGQFALGGTSQGPGSLIEQRAWTTLWSACEELAHFYRRLGQEERLLSLPEAAETLRRLTEGWKIPPIVDEIGRVRVLSASSGRAVKAPYVFILGLVQGTFPAAVGDTAGWDEGELEQLGKAGIEIAPVVSRLEDEMLLFYQLVTRASRRLVLCYPAADHKGEPILPSPFVHEVELAFGGPGIVPRRHPTDLSPIPKVCQPMTQAQWRVLAIHRAQRGDMSFLESFCQTVENQPAVDNIVQGLFLRSKRDSFGVFSEFEGMIGGGSLGEELRRAFAWDRAYSPTELESYVACPFRYMVRDRFKIEPIRDIQVETDFLRRGQRFHKALCQFHARLQERLGSNLSCVPLANLPADELTQLWEESFDPAPPPEAPPLEQAAYQLDKSLWGQLRERYLDQWGAYEKFCQKQFGTVLMPTHFEVWISGGGGQSAQGGKPQDVVEFPIRARQSVRLVGRIDRIDIGQIGDQKVFAVVDYKLSRRSPVTEADWKENIRQGIGLQLAVYLYAAGRLRVLSGGYAPLLAGYWLLDGEGLAHRYVLRAGETKVDGPRKAVASVSMTEDWQEIIGSILPRTCRAIIRAMRRGAFPPAPSSPEECDYCSIRTICRVSECRAYEKNWTWQREDEDAEER